MKLTLTIAQIVISILMVSAILLQQRGTGLGDAFGGGGGTFRSKRGFEKTLFRTTIILAVLFVVSAIGSLIIK